MPNHFGYVSEILKFKFNGEKLFLFPVQKVLALPKYNWIFITLIENSEVYVINVLKTDILVRK